MRSTQARSGIWMQPAAWMRILTTLVAVSVLGSCGQEVVDYDALYVVIRSEAPDGGPITRIDFGAIGFGADDQTLFRLPDQAGDADFQVALPASVDLVNKSYRLRIFTGTQPVTRLQLRVRGLDDSLAVLSGYSGVVETPGKAREITITLKRADLACDADQDGVKNCAIEGCCAPQEASLTTKILARNAATRLTKTATASMRLASMAIPTACQIAKSSRAARERAPIRRSILALRNSATIRTTTATAPPTSP
jgi:hypothetical protein